MGLFSRKTRRKEEGAAVEGDPVGPRAAADDVGTFAREKRTGDPLRGPARALRLSVLMNVVLTFSLLAMASALAALSPLRRDVPYLVQLTDREASIARLAPFVAGADRMANVAEHLAMQWIVVAHEIIPDTEAMSRRWGTACLKPPGPSVADSTCAFMYKHTSGEVYRKFVEVNKKAGIAEKIAKKVTRRVIIDAEPVRKGPGEIEVRFTLVEQQENDRGEITPLQRGSFIANLFYEFRAEEVRHAERFLNPFGFRIVDWTRSALEKKGS